MDTLLENVVVGKQNTIKIDDIYFDPYLVEEESHDARVIMITHSHYDHFSEEDISKVRNKETILIIPKDCLVKALSSFDKNHIVVVEPNQDYVIGDIRIRTVPMYNQDKAFHPKSNEWVGYVINYNDVTYYIVGDSDATEELKSVTCDVLFIPIGGTYTMTKEEAAEATLVIQPKIVVPTHYGIVVGNLQDGIDFQTALAGKIDCRLYLK